MGDGSHQEVGGEGNEEVSTCRRYVTKIRRDLVEEGSSYQWTTAFKR